MNTQCFVEQSATSNILLRVTNVCGLCYKAFEEGETIYYDMHSYRYLCRDCMEKLASNMNEDCIIQDTDASLF